MQADQLQTCKPASHLDSGRPIRPLHLSFREAHRVHSCRVFRALLKNPCPGSQHILHYQCQPLLQGYPNELRKSESLMLEQAAQKQNMSSYRCFTNHTNLVNITL